MMGDADTPMMMLNQPHNVGGMIRNGNADADDDAGRSNNVFSKELAKPKLD